MQSFLEQIELTSTVTSSARLAAAATSTVRATTPSC
jgi:hypothetical protein